MTRAKFNPNLASAWFNTVMQIINNITILSVILTGAALIDCVFFAVALFRFRKAIVSFS